MRRKYPKSALYWKEEQAVWPWRLFFAAEAVLYLWFMVSDVWGRTLLVPADVVKYLSMWGCFFMAAYLYAKKNGSGYMLLAQALILPADLILLFWEPLAWLGILFFIGVQVCYFLRLRRTLRGYLRPRGNQMEAAFLLCAAAVWFAVIGCAALLRLTLSAETVLAALYIVLFAFNLGLAIYEAFRFQKESGIWFAAGLLLFFLCDIHVGLCNLSPALPDVGAAAWYTGQVAPLAMWFFYLPGQVLLVGSGAERSDGWNSRRR